jgi:hypothetical protein
MSESISLTPLMNQFNIENVRAMIAKKKGVNPFLSSNKINAITDMDHVPYNRFFRGIPQSNFPVVMEREAGWRKREDGCYKVIKPNEPHTVPDLCFQAPCSTTYPCKQGEIASLIYR